MRLTSTYMLGGKIVLENSFTGNDVQIMKATLCWLLHACTYKTRGPVFFPPILQDVHENQR